MDLGAKGNAYAAELYARHVTRFPGGASRATGRNRRVMVTGFGLFEGIRFNIAGSVVSSLSDETFWPDNGALGGFPKRSARDGRLAFEDHGTRIVSRTLARPAGEVDFSFAIFDVAWELAPALLAHELRHFKPELLFMIGRGGTIAEIEAGALNRAVAKPGFAPDGVPLGELNMPAGEALLDDYPPGTELKLSWDRGKLGQALAPFMRGLDIELKTHDSARPSNGYICNNLSFVAAHAASGRPLRLAGGAIELAEMPELRGLQTGFLHLPQIDERFESAAEATPVIFELARAVMTGVDSLL
ncbi:MAG TPA: hypothetical protein VFV50_10175 [Bdellovibrionales bacterium]|nr:hypothetical protein [Bdellovibrionales bacterium]